MGVHWTAALLCGVACVPARPSSSSRRRLNALGCPTIDLLPPTLLHRNKQETLSGPDFVWELWEFCLCTWPAIGQVRLQEKKYVARVFCPLPPPESVEACGAQKDCTVTFVKPEPRTARATTCQLLPSYYSLLQSNMLFLICLQYIYSVLVF